MGISPPRTAGSIRFDGRELVGLQSHKIARLGLGYVPQGRRLFPSLTVDEHLRIASRGASSNGSSEWTRERVYDLFPRLAERKRNGGAQLSGGEQQMLAIGRALVTNPKILSWTSRPRGSLRQSSKALIETFRLLEEEGLAILLIEQNLGVATALAERQLVMIGGRIAAETTARELSEDPTFSASTSASSRSRTRLRASCLEPSHLASLSLSCGRCDGRARLAACSGEDEARPDLAFVSTRDGDYAIYEMNADGAAAPADRPTPIFLAGRLYFQIEPAWSPDGTKIAFSSRRGGTFDIYVMHADGTGTRGLTSTKDDDTHPTWSPDASRSRSRAGRTTSLS